MTIAMNSKRFVLDHERRDASIKRGYLLGTSQGLTVVKSGDHLGLPILLMEQLVLACLAIITIEEA